MNKISRFLVCATSSFATERANETIEPLRCWSTELLQGIGSCVGLANRAPVIEGYQGGTSLSCEGEVLFTHAEGLRDVEKNLEANTDTAYLLASLTKAFVAALCGLFVAAGILDWDAPISDYIPIQWEIDPDGGRRITLRDVLTHSTGRAHLDLTWLGVESETIVEKSDLLHVIGHLPLKHDLRAGFQYNNYMYALAGKIIEGACRRIEKGEKRTWAEHLRERIFQPLEMQRTATYRGDLSTSNLAEGHVVLDDRSLRTIPPTDMSDRTAVGGAGSVWSTVPDMLKWAKALLDGIEAIGTERQTLLKEVETLFSPKIAVEQSMHENSYAMGWIRALLPSKGLGFISHNGLQRDHNSYRGMANSYGLGDAPDWTAHIIAEALFDLQPKRDYVSLASARAEFQYHFHASLTHQYNLHRTPNTPQAPVQDFLGVFRNDGLLMTLDITHDTEELSESSLKLLINHRPKQHHRLHHYHFDMLGFLPPTREEAQLREYIDWCKWEQFVLRFQRDAAGNVESLLWRL
ncbi:beta-lactamase/transpeptidase-like protein [Massariosphaeria phaeospora]|uniref:Beta-lactamase/transpeptidase-like protein n=1 Tax=Massariosphaeria phaeospora TaxID=100035 RepID=A0A7C8IH92_9PLEO|nr:beta-lactamase/transpeptidase-like protein [Massariosphaeria phaeospora]